MIGGEDRSHPPRVLGGATDVSVRQFSHIANLHSLRRKRKASNFVFVKTPAELTAMFRASGLKVTPQRQLLFRLMHENKSHPTAESLFLSLVITCQVSL